MSSNSFLDLNLQFHPPRVKKTTYQKRFNLCLYIPAGSAHALHALSGLIKGLCPNHYAHNNGFADFHRVFT